MHYWDPQNDKDVKNPYYLTFCGVRVPGEDIAEHPEEKATCTACVLLHFSEKRPVWLTAQKYHRHHNYNQKSSKK